MSPLTARQAAAIADSLHDRLRDLSLDLTGANVLTEAATDAYAVTAVAAAAAGAEVWALTRDTRFGTAADATRDVALIAQAAGVPRERLHVTSHRDGLPLDDIDLLTNSGHLRPLDAALLSQLPERAVIALMFEAWELREGDIDLAAAARRHLRLFGVDEHHPACGAFEFVGALAVQAALAARWAVRGRPVAVIADSPFAGPVLRAIRDHGGRPVLVCPDPAQADALREGLDVPVVGFAGALTGEVRCDLAVLACRPERVGRLTGSPWQSPGTLAAVVAATFAYGCVQLWGDPDREALMQSGVLLQPETAPPLGHQAIAMNAAGFEAVVRLQTGGLAAAWHGAHPDTPAARSLAGLWQPVDLSRFAGLSP